MTPTDGSYADYGGRGIKVCDRPVRLAGLGAQWSQLVPRHAAMIALFATIDPVDLLVTQWHHGSLRLR
jgi:hypothetical protein